MKKIISAAAVLAAMGVLTVSAYADVYVSIADENGKLVTAMEPVEFKDADGDGTVTINDALILAHDKCYDGGAAAGYASEMGDYGLMLTKLWGVENGGSYGYYVNNASAMSLADEVKDGYIVNAFIYTDLTTWSDTYCYFDSTFSGIEDCSYDTVPDFQLNLTAAAFDENWAPISVPVAGATITVNGEKTDFVTDENGDVTVILPQEDGEYVVSAVSDTQTLVPPVCILSVSMLKGEDLVLDTEEETAVEEAPVEAAPTEEVGTAVTAEVTTTAGDVAAATETAKGSPDTGVADVAAIAGLAVVACGAVVLSGKRK